MTALTIDVLRLFFAFTVVVCIVTIAVVIITNTADVDSMADPTPRHGERGGADDYGGQWVATKDGRVIATSANLSELVSALRNLGASGAVARYVPDHDPRVPADVMRRIDAALPREQAWGKWVQYREAERQ